jgi:predicted deacylase
MVNLSGEGAMLKKPFNLSEVKRGTKEFGYLSIVDSLAAKIDIPVGVVNGSSNGHTLAVTAGLFGHEYCGIEAASRLYQQVRPENLSGRLLIVPVVNVPCLQFRTPWFNLARSVSPLDGLNVNPLFPGDPGESEAKAVTYRQYATVPGDPTGSVTKVLAYRLFHDIILQSDYHVDLRGGDLDESHMVHTVFLRIGEEIDEKCEEMAKAFGFDYVLPGTPRIGHTSRGTLIHEAVTRGIPSIISESGLGYRTQPLEQYVMLHVTGVTNLMKHLGMITGEPVKPKDQKFLNPTWYWIPAPVAGMFHAVADQGDLVKHDQLLGRLTDLDGSELCQIVSPIDGVVHCMFPRRLVAPGDDVYTLLEIAGPTGW